jgi:hypothetical protein
VEGAAHLPGLGAELLKEGFDLAQNSAGVFVEDVPGGGEKNAFAAALEKIDPEGKLEVAHLLGNIGLGNAEAIGGAAEAAGFGDGDKVAEMPDLKGLVNHSLEGGRAMGGWQRWSAFSETFFFHNF